MGVESRMWWWVGENEIQDTHRKRPHLKKKFKGKCPDYDPKVCDTKLEVYICWNSDKHREFRCPIIEYREDEKEVDEEN